MINFLQLKKITSEILSENFDLRELKTPMLNCNYENGEQKNDSYMSQWFSFSIGTGKRASEKIDFAFEIRLDKERGNDFLFYNPKLFSFSNGKKLIHSEEGKGKFSHPVTNEDCIVNIKQYVDAIKESIKTARLEEKKGSFGNAVTLESGVVKQEVRKGIYKFTLGNHFILGEYLSYTAGRRRPHNSFSYKIYYKSIYNPLVTSYADDPENDAAVIRRLLEKQ